MSVLENVSELYGGRYLTARSGSTEEEELERMKIGVSAAAE